MKEWTKKWKELYFDYIKRNSNNHLDKSIRIVMATLARLLSTKNVGFSLWIRGGTMFTTAVLLCDMGNR